MAQQLKRLDKQDSAVTTDSNQPPPVAPVIFPNGRKAGVGLHFSSLPGPYGIGDVGTGALEFIDKLASMKIRVWQFLPTGPTAFGNSPYQPLSAFAGNEMLIGIEPLLRRGLLMTDEAATLTGLSKLQVNYDRLIPLKQSLLKQAARRFKASAGPELKSAYEAFLVLNDSHWLNDYAVYRVLKSLHDERPWPEWDRDYVRRKPAAMRRVQGRFQAEIETHKIIQFLFDRQWQNLKRYAHEHDICLFGDMPIYIALDSADAWAHPEILLLDRKGRCSQVAGVPPDYFSEDGQLWGNPLYDWKYHKANGYQWWIERMQHAVNQADLVRIDHFRGFESFWAIEAGAETAREGRWVPGPGDALFNAMKTALGSLQIVAEDLGVITPEVEGLRDRHDIPGMKVLQFLVGGPDFDPASIKKNSVCYTGTHDNDTTLGWFNGGADDTRSEQEIIETRVNALKVSGGSAKGISRAMIRLAFNSQARLAVAPLQDYLGLGSEARLNIPGTTSNNWCWRVNEEQLSEEFCESVAKLVEESSRA